MTTTTGNGASVQSQVQCLLIDTELVLRGLSTTLRLPSWQKEVDLDAEDFATMGAMMATAVDALRERHAALLEAIEAAGPSTA